jgi:hypothetical protein
MLALSPLQPSQETTFATITGGGRSPHDRPNAQRGISMFTASQPCDVVLIVDATGASENDTLIIQQDRLNPMSSDPIRCILSVIGSCSASVNVGPCPCDGILLLVP